MNGIAAAHSDPGILTVLLSYWWVLLIWGGAMLEWLGERYNMGVAAIARRRREKRKHELKRLRLELALAQARSGVAVQEREVRAEGAAPCTHPPRKLTPVVSDDELVAWLCKACDAQLPADAAVRPEDLA